MIDLAAVAALRAVEAQGTVAGAAAELGFTPSAVSQQVKRLERQAGVPLLERVGRGVVLTGHGRDLVRAGGRLLSDLEELQTDLHRRAASTAGQLRLATFSTATRGLVAPVLRTLRDTHPDLHLTLTEHEPWDAVDLVAAGRVDVALVHRWGDVVLEVPDHVETTPIADDAADVLVPQGHRLAGRRRVTPTDLLDEDWVATPDGTICRQWLSRMFVGTGRAPRIVHTAAEFDSHLALVRAGLGVALVPRLGRQPLGRGLVALAASDPEPTREVLALCRRSMSGSPAVQAVLDALAAHGRSTDGLEARLAGSS